MQVSDPRFLYIIFVIPILFSMALLGDGIHKISNKHGGGLINIGFGISILILVVFGYMLLAN